MKLKASTTRLTSVGLLLILVVSSFLLSGAVSSLSSPVAIGPGFIGVASTVGNDDCGYGFWDSARQQKHSPLLGGSAPSAGLFEFTDRDSSELYSCELDRSCEGAAGSPSIFGTTSGDSDFAL